MAGEGGDTRNLFAFPTLLSAPGGSLATPPAPVEPTMRFQPGDARPRRAIRNVVCTAPPPRRGPPLPGWA
jgi:hypothetical protein